MLGITANANDVAVRLEAAGAGTGGLAFDNNEIRVDVWKRCYWTANGVDSSCKQRLGQCCCWWYFS